MIFEELPLWIRVLIVVVPGIYGAMNAHFSAEEQKRVANSFGGGRGVP